jgi:hypothetical protein
MQAYHQYGVGSRPALSITKKGWTRLAAASDKAYQLLGHGRWFSPGTPASSTTKTGRHDIAEILLRVVLNTKDHHLIAILGGCVVGCLRSLSCGHKSNTAGVSSRPNTNPQCYSSQTCTHGKVSSVRYSNNFLVSPLPWRLVVVKLLINC